MEYLNEHSAQDNNQKLTEGAEMTPPSMDNLIPDNLSVHNFSLLVNGRPRDIT